MRKFSDLTCLRKVTLVAIRGMNHGRVRVEVGSQVGANPAPSPASSRDDGGWCQGDGVEPVKNDCIGDVFLWYSDYTC